MTDIQKKALDDLAKRTLPRWEDLPDLELYMDQVLSLVERYLHYGEDRGLTASMVNNYVKQKVLPPPVNKRYGRGHIAALLMLCILKSVMPISAIQKLFHSCGGVDSLPRLYSGFCELYTSVNSMVSSQLSQLKVQDGSSLFLCAALGSQAAQAVAMELLGEFETD